MEDEKITCFFNEQSKQVNLQNNFKIFTTNCAKSFGIEKDLNDLEFYIQNSNDRIKISDQKSYNENVIHNNEDIIFIEYKKVRNKRNTSTPSPNDNYQLLEKKIEKLENDLSINKKKLEDYQDKCYDLEILFEKYQKEQEEKFNNFKEEILNMLAKKNDNSSDEEKPIKRKKNETTPTGDNERVIRNNKTPTSDEDDKRINRRSNKKTPKDEDEKKSDLENYNDKEFFNKYKKNSKQNYYNNNPNIFFNENNYQDKPNQIINNESNISELQNNIIKKKSSKIETLKGSKNKDLSCKIITNSRTPAKLKSQIIQKKPIKFSIDILNNGTIPIPGKTYIKPIQNDTESDLIIEETIINNGKEVGINERIQVSLFVNLKNYKNIKNGINIGKFILWNEKYSQIGNEGIVKIEIIDENKNIIENNEISKTHKEISKEDYSVFNFEQNDQRKMTHQVKPNEFNKMIEGNINEKGDNYDDN